MSGFCPNGTMCAPEDMNCIHPRCRENGGTREPCDSLSGAAQSAAAPIAAPTLQLTASSVETVGRADLLATLTTMRDRDNRNGSLPIWYRAQIDAAIAKAEGRS